MTDKICPNCKGVLIDPEHTSTETYGDGIVRSLPEPCAECQLTEPPGQMACSGVSTYGHGLTMRTVHWGCCPASR